MVQALVREGHEVQSHGYSHRPLNRMNQAALRDEVERAKKTVEDAAGTSVTAFRAQDFSVLGSNLWALETIAGVGFEIDSSIFPMQSARYGIGGWTLAPHHVILSGGVRLLEVPVAIWARGSLRVPVAGGGYFRVLPETVLERSARSTLPGGRRSSTATRTSSLRTSWLGIPTCRGGFEYPKDSADPGSRRE
jgi:hypothetical protein